MSPMSKDEFKQHLSSQTKAHRQRKAMPLRELAEQTGIPLTTLHMIERGKSLPSVYIIYKVCDALDIDINNFLNPKMRVKSIDEEILEKFNI